MYPWRLAPNPYRTLVSEILLQQTQAARVVPAFDRFVARVPDVEALATASRADVVRAWDGLGYNRRAVALSQAARAIVRDHAGAVPADPSELRALPGVGPYTAAAVDVNVRRVVSRAVLGVSPADAPARAVDGAAAAWLDRRRPAEWNQALMDLGREVCRPAPRCDACPIEPWCRWRSAGGAIAGDGAGRPRRRQEAFEGSFRQVRGGVLRVLRDRSDAAHPTAIAVHLGFALDDVRRAVAALQAEGAVETDERGQVRLAESDRDSG